MTRKEYRSKCCNAKVKTDGLPDFIGGNVISTVSPVCLKCGKGCNIVDVEQRRSVGMKNKPQRTPKFLARLPHWWSKEMREMARLILEKSVASDFESMRRELHLTSSILYIKEILPRDLAEVLNTLIQRGLLKTLIGLTNDGKAFFLFYNPRKYRP